MGHIVIGDHKRERNSKFYAYSKKDSQNKPESRFRF